MFKLFSPGVGMVMRKMGNSVSPTVELVKDGDEYSFNTTSTFKNTTIKFKLGEEFDEETLDGRKVKSTMTLDGNKLVQDQKGDKAHQIIREFTDTDLTAVSFDTPIRLILYTVNLKYVNISYTDNATR